MILKWHLCFHSVRYLVNMNCILYFYVCSKAAGVGQGRGGSGGGEMINVMDLRQHKALKYLSPVCLFRKLSSVLIS